jgi:hypothetical protein
MFRKSPDVSGATSVLDCADKVDLGIQSEEFLSRSDQRNLAYEACDDGLLSPDPAAETRRVKGAKRVRIGNWLTIDQSKALLQQSPSSGLRGNLIAREWRLRSDADCIELNWWNSEWNTTQSARSTLSCCPR